MKNRIAIWIIAFLIFAAGVIFDSLVYQTDIFPEPDDTTSARVEGIEGSVHKVAQIVDGDTIKLESGQTLRYIGIDTPETRHPRRGLECFGKEATEANRKLVEGKEVIIVKDISETDRFNRLLRYVWVMDGEDQIFVNYHLVRHGYATAASFPPDVKYQQLFIQAQTEAREQNLGLWSDCP